MFRAAASRASGQGLSFPVALRFRTRASDSPWVDTVWTCTSEQVAEMTSAAGRAAVWHSSTTAGLAARNLRDIALDCLDMIDDRGGHGRDGAVRRVPVGPAGGASAPTDVLGKLDAARL